MIYDLLMHGAGGETVTLKYDAHNSRLLDPDGNSLINTNPRKWNGIHKVSPDDPGIKGDIKVLKIQLGLKCNYSCGYCSQSSHIPDASNSNNQDAEEFLTNLDKWFKGDPERIEFWGGEPFVYWSKIKIMAPALRERFPKARLSIVTNGSLLNEEKVDFILKHNISIAVSHDGPQQKFRGPDPLQDETVVHSIKQLQQMMNYNFSFNVVLHAKNYDLDAIHSWFHERFPKAKLNLEGIVNVYDNYTLNQLGRFSREDYQKLTMNVFYELINNKTRFGTLTSKHYYFLKSLMEQRPIMALGQKCGMDRDDRIAVDLHGNVMTCQNVGGTGVHKIGTVDKYDEIRLNTSLHLSKREECMSCPVVQLCQGSCMFLMGDFFSQSCWNEYYYNLGIFMAALYHITGMVLTRINGQVCRPEFSPEHLKKHPSLLDLYK